MTGMFHSAPAFNQPLSWDTSSVTRMSDMFYAANSLSAANKLRIRCAWAGTPAFASAGYGSGWAPDSYIFADKASLKTAATEYNSNAAAATAKYGPIDCWDVSGVTDMRSLFSNLRNFNADISGWDTSRVTDMNLMFYLAHAFNQPLDWDTSRVTDMAGMFSNAYAFNQPLDWDTSRVTGMNGMFAVATAFNQPLDWDTSGVTNMHAMFWAATAFNQPLDWDTSSVAEMRYMFSNANSLSAANKLRIRCAWAGTPAFASAGYGSGWAPDSYIFADKASLKTAATEYDSNAAAATAKYGPIDCWDVSGVTDMSWLFYNLRNFNANISGWDTSRVTDMDVMFAHAYAFNQPLRWNTSSVTDMSNMFNQAYAFNQPLDWDTSSVTDMSRMFYRARAFNQQLDWDTSGVTDMTGMFYYAEAFNQPLDWDTSGVTDMNRMFLGTAGGRLI